MEPSHVLRQCPDCNGNGYVPRLTPIEEAPAPQPFVMPPMPVYNPTTNQWEQPTPNGPAAYVPPATPAVSTT